MLESLKLFMTGPFGIYIINKKCIRLFNKQLILKCTMNNNDLDNILKK